MRISDWSSDVCSSDLLAVLRQREFGLFLPAVLQAFELGDVAAHFLLVRDRAGGGGANFDECFVHLEDDLADPLFGVFGPVEQVGDVGRSEEHTSELQSLMRISYAVFCLKNTKNKRQTYRKKKTQQYDETY